MVDDLVVVLGYHYRSAVVSGIEAASFPTTLVLNGQPGSRAPHVWLERGDNASRRLIYAGPILCCSVGLRVAHSMTLLKKGNLMKLYVMELATMRQTGVPVPGNFIRTGAAVSGNFNRTGAAVLENFNRTGAVASGDLIRTGAPVPGYLVQTDDGTNVLIDTGYGKERIGTYRQSLDDPIQMDEEHYVVNQLARLSLTPQDIHYLVCTHFDPDHTGNHDVFTAAELVVQRRHYEAARSGKIPRLQDTRPHWDAPGLRYRLVDGDTELLPGITLVETSGHIIGHQSVLLHLPQTGAVILAGDAIPNTDCLDPETRLVTPLDLDEAGVRASTRKLVELARREQVSLLVCGHDAVQWQQLKKLPEFYE